MSDAPRVLAVLGLIARNAFLVAEEYAGDEVAVDATELRIAEVDGVRITRVVIRLPSTAPEEGAIHGGEDTHDHGP